MGSESASCSSSDLPSTIVVDLEIEGEGDNPEEIPLEIVTEEEMALIDAAIASARGIIRSSSSIGNRTIALSSLRRCKKNSPISTRASSDDVEDPDRRLRTAKSSPLKLFPTKKALSVTDLTATEWCEKQMEFVLIHGKPAKTKAMKAGSDRHLELEEEIITKIEISIKSLEDSWALKLINFIFGSQQLLLHGLTRELPIFGMVEGIWMVGVIDEIRISSSDAVQWPLLVDTKTRHTATLPSEAQKRNGRLQLMCYKYLWDSTVSSDFHRDEFYRHFELDPAATLSEDVINYSIKQGLQAKTLDDVVRFFSNNCPLLPPSQDKLILRYEFQGNRSILEEYLFDYDGDWFKGQMKGSIEFWGGVLKRWKKSHYQ
ncbi:exonuclease V-like protein isoform X2 [Wolffia australiana]